MPRNVQVSAGPTKAFFVRMLTKDIELADAILDLLDNCVDGILRRRAAEAKATKKAQKLLKPTKRPYKEFWADIEATPEGFVIHDNCGGIPEKIAEKYAFMLGRPDPERDADLETVGMYGIGMKRAIFKMGLSSVVTSHPVGEDSYKVVIPPEWLVDDHDWDLDLVEADQELEEYGTRIEVTDLHPGIRRQFEEDSDFLKNLVDRIGEHYSVILGKGFQITVNGTEVPPAELTILAPGELGTSGGPAVEPYLFLGNVDGVDVELAVGFYRPLATENELDDEIKVRRSREMAGWTVICNDRVVLYNDKSQMTGWGTATVPGYHNQFISIAGVVYFRSKDSAKLPLNTTKRGLDTSSEVYLTVLDYMREGLKKFTTFTNWWKRREEETEGQFGSLEQLAPRDVLTVAKRLGTDKFTRVAKANVKDGRRYSPNLPKPTNREQNARICFAAAIKDIELVAEYYFGDRDVDRADIGKKCFEESLELAKDQRR